LTYGEEVSNAIWKTLVKIFENETEKAIQRDDYEDALVASFLEGLFKEAVRE